MNNTMKTETAPATLTDAAALAKHRHYPFVLVFERAWTHGTALAGLTMEDAIGFCTAGDCESWVTSINAQHAKSIASNKGGRAKMTYKVTSYRVVSR